MMLYKNSKTVVCSPDGDTDFFTNEKKFTEVLQGDTLKSYMFIICLHTKITY